MTDSNQPFSDSEDSQKVYIEIPAHIFEAMYRCMGRRDPAGSARSSCCGTTREMCCPQPESDGKEGFTFVLKRKE